MSAGAEGEARLEAGPQRLTGGAPVPERERGAGAGPAEVGRCGAGWCVRKGREQGRAEER